MGQGNDRLLIDTGEGKPSWAQALKHVLEEEHASIKQVLLTHWHPDHVGGVKDVLDICPTAQIYKHNPKPGAFDISDKQVFRVDGATLHASLTPGHTTDHMTFVLENEGAMFTGDNVLGQGTAVFEDLSSYMASLQRMRDGFAGCAYPGHGPVIEDGKAKIDEYIEHRQRREHQVIDVLTASDRQMSAADVVKVIYKDYPITLHAAAENGVQQILDKLERQDMVSCHRGRYNLSRANAASKA